MTLWTAILAASCGQCATCGGANYVYPQYAAPVQYAQSAQAFPLQVIGNAAPVAPGSPWQAVDGKPDWLGLFQDGRQVGAYSKAKHAYYPKNADGTFGSPCPAPADLPAGVTVGETYNGGIQVGKLSQRPKYTLNTGSGPETSDRPDRVFEAIGGDAKVPDDGKNRRLYVVHPDAAVREKMKAEAEAAVAESGAADVSVKALAPTNYLVSEYGFKPNADGPTTYLVRHDGFEFWREDRQVSKAELVEGLRKINPYDPAQSRKIKSDPLPDLLGGDNALILAAAVAFVVFLIARKRDED